MSLIQPFHQEDSQRHCSGKLEMKNQTNISSLSEFRLVSGDAGNTGRSEGEKVFCEKCTQTLSIGTHWSLLSPSNSINPMETENSQK